MASQLGTSLSSFDLRGPVFNTRASHFAPPNNEDRTLDDAGEYREADELESQGSVKRRRLTTTDFTRRKRAAVACQFCRVRKTKCDNVRPQCGYCVRQKAQCIYGDMEANDADVQSSQEQVSNEQLMGRLEEIKEMLQKVHLTGDSVSTPSTTTASLAVPGQSRDMGSPSVTTPWTRFSQPATSAAPVRGSQRAPFEGLRCESLLKWPCLAGMIPPSERNSSSFPLSAGYKEARKMQGTSAQSGKGIRDDDLVPLCRKFLAEVHPRNPVLDDQELLRYARHAAENGVGWDSASCLVLLACALSSYTKPWIKPRDQSHPLGEDEVQELIDVEDQDGAEAYYVAAQKRLGLLGNSIQDIQCFFFATIFEKFSLRPLRAWFHVQQACNRLEARLLQRGERPLMPFREPNPENYHLEQRLYWSCFRAESELVFELGMNPSGLQDFSYPDAFPSPPDELFAQPSLDTAESPYSISEEQRKVNERGWCYYLSEISIRRTVDETLNLLYRHGEEYWMKNPSYLIRQYHETEQQISSWYYHLPASVKYIDNIIPEEEFAAGLQGRSSLWQEYALRPVFYYVLHCPPGQAVPAEAHDLAAREVQICTRLVQRCAFSRRHGGTWLICRKIFTAACVILIAALHPHRVQPPEDWPGLTLLAVQILNRWGRDAQDIQRMADVLGYMYEEICVQGMQPSGATGASRDR